VSRTAGVLEHWRRAGQAGVARVVVAEATADPGRVQPGMIFVQDFGGGAGHTGLVEAVEGGRLVTLEGNTNDDGSREGIGVFRRTGRKILSINKGFVDYAGR
jgi:CHAP domain